MEGTAASIDAVLDQMSKDPGIHQLVPYFVQFIPDQVSVFPPKSRFEIQNMAGDATLKEFGHVDRFDENDEMSIIKSVHFDRTIRILDTCHFWHSRHVDDILDMTVTSVDALYFDLYGG